MQAAVDTVCTFHFTARAGEREVDSSRGHGRPLTAVLGKQTLIAGLEDALLGHSAGDRFVARIAPRDAYGERDPAARQRVPRKHLAKVNPLEPGAVVQLTDNGTGALRLVTVLKVGMTVVDIDLNHPLAGETLDFDLEVLEIRPASESERKTGRVDAAPVNA
jgi:FKBP-type peptidyl-prolyl cis-trans isomerase SlyD